MIASRPTRSQTEPKLTAWDVSPESYAKIRALDATSLWLRSDRNSSELSPYHGKYIAARDCQVIAAADTMEELYALLRDEAPETFLIASFKGGRIRLNAI